MMNIIIQIILKNVHENNTQISVFSNNIILHFPENEVLEH